MTRFPRERTGTTMGIAGIAMGFAPNIGRIIGGALVGCWGWRSFYMHTCGAFVAAWARLRSGESAGPRWQRRRCVRLPVAGTSTLGLRRAALASLECGNMPLSAPACGLPALSGAGCVAALLVRQDRIAHPLICLGIFASRHYRAGVRGAELPVRVVHGHHAHLPLFVQGSVGYTALDAGIVFIPATVMALFVNPLAGVLADRVGARAVAVTGAVLLIVGSRLHYVRGCSDSAVGADGAAGGARCGCERAGGAVELLGSVGLDPADTMDGSVFFATARQVCASLGTALMMLIVGGCGRIADLAGVGGAHAGRACPRPYQAAFALSTLFAGGAGDCPLENTLAEASIIAPKWLEMTKHRFCGP